MLYHLNPSQRIVVNNNYFFFRYACKNTFCTIIAHKLKLSPIIVRERKTLTLLFQYLLISLNDMKQLN